MDMVCFLFVKSHDVYVVVRAPRAVLLLQDARFKHLSMSRVSS